MGGSAARIASLTTFPVMPEGARYPASQTYAGTDSRELRIRGLDL